MEQLLQNDSWYDLLKSLEADPRWNGLCEEFCRALNLQWSMVNQDRASHSLLSIFAQQSHEDWSGVTSERISDVWFTCAQKGLEGLRDAFGLMHPDTMSVLRSYLQSLRMHQISSNKPTQQHSTAR